LRTCTHHTSAPRLALVEQGLNDCEISRRLGFPRRTILDWRRPTYVPRWSVRINRRESVSMMVEHVGFKK
jgi:hypothetical protein